MRAQRLGSCRQCPVSPASVNSVRLPLAVDCLPCSLQPGSTVQPLVAVNEPVLVLVPASEPATPARGLKQAGEAPSTVGAPTVAPAVVELPAVFAPALTPIVVAVPATELMAADIRRGLKQVRRWSHCLHM